ncbi:hypothetical protein GALMADRAFT_237009 [Galerina marginata CBS 339.88]|uniref:Arrestin-like N-terminal domain-containing protein n=1 Tax=Galerina marginata (strain CBS 339.88) TaxID=685588 RepID=A0A067TM73_GALM3|nr:hypothetical protein GALMADRAFT_237009 [Galerina marginata CBS 339.88]
MPYLDRSSTNASIETFSTTSNSQLPPYSVIDSSERPGLQIEPSLSDSSPPQDDQTSQFPGVGVESDRQSTYAPSVPPRYSTISTLPVSLTGGLQNGSSPHFEHAFVIPDANPWATLRIFTQESIAGLLDSPRSKPEYPLFYGDGPVMGVLELELESPRTIRQITVSIRGKVLSGFVDDGVKFLDYTHSLWHKHMGDPRSTSQSTTKKFDGNLVGSYQFPFSFPFPAQVDISSLATSGTVTSFPSASLSSPVSSKANKKHTASSTTKGKNSEPSLSGPLPPSFDEVVVQARVRYELIVHIIHGRLRTDSKIQTQISYMPSFAPGPASLKRQEAYSNDAMAPGPISDPDGWVSLPTCIVKGELSTGKQVNIECMLYLAKPLCYARGATIPCFLTLASEDSNSLALLGGQKNPRVRLMRRVRHANPHNKDVLKTVVNEISFGVWWMPSKEVMEKPNLRHLQGEIHLPSDMKPSYTMPSFRIEVCLSC